MGQDRIELSARPETNGNSINAFWKLVRYIHQFPRPTFSLAHREIARDIPAPRIEPEVKIFSAQDFPPGNSPVPTECNPAHDRHLKLPPGVIDVQKLCASQKPFYNKQTDTNGQHISRGRFVSA